MVTVNKSDKIEKEEINKCKLIDICKIKIHSDLPPKQKMANYLEQIKNPYCFLSNGNKVHVKFQDSSDMLSDKLKDYFSSSKKLYEEDKENGSCKKMP